MNDDLPIVPNGVLIPEWQPECAYSPWSVVQHGGVSYRYETNEAIPGRYSRAEFDDEERQHWTAREALVEVGTVVWAGAEETHRDPWAGLPEYRVARFTYAGPDATMGGYRDQTGVVLGTVVVEGQRSWIVAEHDGRAVRFTAVERVEATRYLPCDIWEIQP